MTTSSELGYSQELRCQQLIELVTDYRFSAFTLLHVGCLAYVFNFNSEKEQKPKRRRR